MKRICKNCKHCVDKYGDSENWFKVCKHHSYDSKTRSMLVMKEGGEPWDADFACEIWVMDEFGCIEFEERSNI